MAARRQFRISYGLTRPVTAEEPGGRVPPCNLACRNGSATNRRGRSSARFLPRLPPRPGHDNPPGVPRPPAKELRMRQAWIGVSCVLMGLSLVACDKGTDDIGEQFVVRMSGANEVPARGTAANGVIGINVRGNRVDYSIDVHGISAITGAHSHSGASGVNGRIRIALYPGPGSNFSTTPSGA